MKQLNVAGDYDKQIPRHSLVVSDGLNHAAAFRKAVPISNAMRVFCDAVFHFCGTDDNAAFAEKNCSLTRSCMKLRFSFIGKFWSCSTEQASHAASG
ncbi:MAG: hypothetical protein HZC43_11145 [Nitrosomonadales bacterium]|nr:hypothetical protein [Nitrosomonadales bacterium]